MVVSDLRGGMLVRRTSTGKTYRIRTGFDGGPIVTVNDHGTWVSVQGQKNGKDYGRIFGFHPEELEPADFS